MTINFFIDINVGLKSVRTFSNVKNDKFICLVGVENEEDIISITSNETNTKLIYSPFPRKGETEQQFKSRVSCFAADL